MPLLQATSTFGLRSNYLHCLHIFRHGTFLVSVCRAKAVSQRTRMELFHNCRRLTHLAQLSRNIRANWWREFSDRFVCRKMFRARTTKSIGVFLSLNPTRTQIGHRISIFLNINWCGRSFVRSLQAGVQPTLNPRAETVSRSNALAQGERTGIGWCVRVCVWCAGQVG